MTICSPTRLNLGCGRDIRAGWVNIDAADLPGVDIVADLDACGAQQLPFPDDYADELLLSHLLEHIRNPLPLMQELWRVAKPDAALTVKLPHGANDEAWTDPTHVRPYFGRSFGYFSQPFYHRADYGYRGDWRTEQVVYTVPRQPFGRMEAAQILHHIDAFRNVVLEMIVEMRAIKPAREPRADLQVAPQFTIRLAG